MATADIIVTANANRAMIHDEVSTILRGIKCMDITVQLTGPTNADSPHSPTSHGRGSSHRHYAGGTEEDLYSNTASIDSSQSFENLQAASNSY